MNLDLKNKNALVCGSSKGIGKATAFMLASLGANVTLVSRSADKMSEIVKDLQVTGEQDHDFLVADFTDLNDLKKRVKTLVHQKNIHILINNTGGPKGGPLLAAEGNEFAQGFHNHIICSHELTKIVVPGMKADQYGRVINIISTSVKEPIPGLGVSNTIRGAMGNWAKTMAGELGAFGVTVNNILPGYTNTGRLASIIESKAAQSDLSIDEVSIQMKRNVPLKRFAEPEEVANAIAFLASPAAAYISGINLPVDGGRTKSL
jgi:3-oxoacyl-[acyl-carrier protein] reductase